jgi:hypothetical protein
MSNCPYVTIRETWEDLFKHCTEEFYKKKFDAMNTTAVFWVITQRAVIIFRNS